MANAMSFFKGNNNLVSMLLKVSDAAGSFKSTKIKDGNVSRKYGSM